MALWIMVLSITGIFFLIICGLGLKKHAALRKNCTLWTTGTVKEIAAKRYRLNHSDSRDVMYHPVIEYEVGGTVYIERSNTGSNPCKYQVGQQVKLCCSRENPSRFYLPGKSLYRTVSLVFGAVGLIYLAITVVLLLHIWR